MPGHAGQGRARELLDRIAGEEAALARLAACGDRDAFDTLFDRYCARMAHAFRTLPDAEAQAKTWEALEQLFASLDGTCAAPLAVRAFRVAKASRPGRVTPRAAQPRRPRTGASRSGR